MGAIYSQPIALDLGIDYQSVTFPYFQADGLTPKSLVELTARLMFRVNYGDQIPQISITDQSNIYGQVFLGLPPNGGILVPMNGLVAFSVTQLGTQQFQDRSGVWSLYLDDPTVSPTKTVYLANGTWALAKTAIR